MERLRRRKNVAENAKTRGEEKSLAKGAPRRVCNLDFPLQLNLG
jgi:hypothetical protein